MAGIANLPSRTEALDTAEEKAAIPAPQGVPPNGFSDGRRVMNANGLRPLELNDLWGEAMALDGDVATLPLDLVTQFAPPALWPMFETSIRWGPNELAGCFRRYALLAAQGKAPNCGQLSRGSIETRLTYCWKWMQTLQEVHDGRYRHQLTGDVRAALDQWAFVPKRLDVKTLKARPAKRDRTAPELEAVRFAYYNLEQRIANKRKTQNGRRALFGLLRDRALLHIFTLGPRAETIASMRLEDVDWKNNRIRLRELKGQREDTAEGVWKDVHPKLIADIREFIEYLGVTNSRGHTPYDQLNPETYGADDPGSAYRNHTRPKALPLWVRGRIYFNETTGARIQASGEGAANLTLVGRGLEARPDPTFPKPTSLSMHIAMILKPYTGGIAKSGHTLRHLAEQLAQQGAREHLNTHDEPAHITEAAIAAALLDHTMPGGISAIYADLESQRGRLARIAAHAITEYIAGERGARLGLDEERIIATRRQYQEAQAELIAAQARIAELELDMATIGTREHPLYTRIASLREQRRTKRAKALSDGQSRSEQEYRRLDQELKQLDDELDELRDELAALQGRLAADFSDEARIERGATARLHRAEEALREATEARIPLPPGQEPPDPDKRLQKLLRGTDLLEDDDVKDQEPELVRDGLTVKEYAIVMGIVHPTMRRYIRIALASEDGFPFSGGASNHRNPWFQPIEEILEVHGPRMRRFSFDALDLSRYTPGQIAAMKHLLSTMPAAGE